MPRRLATSLLAVAALVAVACGADGGSGTALDREQPTTTSAPPATTEDPAGPPPPTDPPLPPEAEAAPRIELPDPLRATWVHLFDDTLKTPAGLEQVLDEAAAAGLDAVFVQVVRRHDAYYASDVLPATPDPALAPGFDLLAAAIEGGHRRGLQVHAWFTVATATHPAYDALVLPEGHVYRDHGPTSADSWMTVSHAGIESPDYFDIGLLEVQDHVAAIVGDIASNYEVDGVHLDYVRYDGAEWGYHPRALERFAAETGQQGLPGPQDDAWAEWRRAQSRAIVARAQAELTAVRPEALLSAAVIAQGPGPGPDAVGGLVGTRAYADYRQDWAGWVAEGLLDLAIPMAYFREDVAEHALWYRQWVSFAAELDGAHPDVAVATGIGGWLNAASQGLEQARLALDVTAGVVVFSYQQDTSEDSRGTLLHQLDEL